MALVHYPVLDRQDATVTTAITNIDLHDLARTAHTYGLSDVFIVHPILAQRTLAERVREHWVHGSGGRRIPDRKPALERLRVVPALTDVLAELGPEVETWVTSAAESAAQVEHPRARELLLGEGGPVLLCFGTGWGLCPSVLAEATLKLAPVRSPRADGYNHLSVRAAAAIIIDRLVGG